MPQMMFGRTTVVGQIDDKTGDPSSFERFNGQRRIGLELNKVIGLESPDKHL